MNNDELLEEMRGIVREEVKAETEPIKTDLQDIKADLVKHQRRIENLEENTKTPNPHKN